LNKLKNGAGVRRVEMKKSEIIKSLRSSRLIAECPTCGEEFRLSDAVMFDAFGKFPSLAEQKRREMVKELKERLNTLKKRKISALDAEKKAVEIGVGKIFEKIAPAYKSFGVPCTDCRPLFDPIDLIVFRGLTNKKVKHITFLDIKTGESGLNKHQKMIRDAVYDKKVEFKEV